MDKRNHYSVIQKRKAMVYLLKTALPSGMSLEQASAGSEKHLGFHVPASTFSMWKRDYRKHRKPARSPRPRQVTHERTEAPTEPEAINQRIMDQNKEALNVGWAQVNQQRALNANLSSIAKSLHKMVEVEERDSPLPVVIVGHLEKRPWWKLW